MPCETGVNIPLNFQLYNDTFMFKDPEMNVMLYNNMLSPNRGRRIVKSAETVKKRVPAH